MRLRRTSGTIEQVVSSRTTNSTAAVTAALSSTDAESLGVLRTAPVAVLLLPRSLDQSATWLNAAAIELLQWADSGLVTPDHRLNTAHPLALQLHATALQGLQTASAVTLMLGTQRVEVHPQPHNNTSLLLWLKPEAPTSAALELTSTNDDLTRQSAVARYTSNAVIITDALGRIEWVNSAFTRLTGYTTDDCRGRKPGSLLQGRDTDPATVATMSALLERGAAVPRLQILNYAKDGSPFWVELEIQPIKNANGALTGFISVETDVTERRSRELALMELQERLDLALDATQICFFERLLHGQEVTFTGPALQVLGYEPPTLVSDYRERIHAEDLPRLMDAVERRLYTLDVIDVEHRVRDSAGRWRTLYSRMRMVDYGGVPRVVGVLQDVTWRKQAEREMQRMQERLQIASSAGHFGFFEQSFGQGENYWDRTCFALFERDPVLGAPTLADVAPMLHPADRDRLKSYHEQLRLRPPGTEFVSDYRILLKSGAVRHIESRGRTFAEADGKSAGIVGLMIDVTDQQRTLERLRSLGQRLELATQVAGIGIWELDYVTGAGQWNEQLFEIYGRAPHLGPIPPQQWLDAVHHEDRELAENMSVRLVKQPGPHEFDFRIVRPDGKIAWLSAHALAIGDERGRVVRLIGTTLDVTAQRQQASELSGLHRRLQLAVDTVGLGVWEMDWASGEIFLDARLVRMMGRGSTPRRLTLDEFAELIPAREREATVAAFRAQVEAGSSEGLSFPICLPDGEERDLLANFYVERDIEGKPVRVIGTDLDVTDLRRYERALADSNQRFELAAQAAHLGVFEVDVVQGHLRWDARSAALHGLSAQPIELSYEDWYACLHEDDRDLTRSRVSYALDQLANARLEYRVVLSDGSTRELISAFNVTRNAEQQALRAVGTTLDVTELRNAERSARAAAERLEMANALSKIGVLERDKNDQLIHIDLAMLELFGLQQYNGRISNELIFSRILGEDRAAVDQARALMRGTDEPVRVEFRIERAPGDIRDVIAWRRRRVDKLGVYAGEVGALMDVTELRSAERRAQEYASRLALAQSSAGMGVWELKLPSGEIIWDSEMLRLFGVTQELSSYGQLRQLVHSEDLARFEKAIQDCIQHGTSFDAEFRVITAEGQVKVLAGRGEVLRDRQGAPVRMVGINWDVTSRHTAEAQAREASERLELAARSAGLGIWDRDLISGELLWDHRMFELFGRTEAEASARQVWQEGLHPEDRVTVQTQIEQAVRSGDSYSGEFRIVLPNGQTRWLAARGVVRRNAQGTPVRLLGVKWDVTDARLAEAALRAKETAERANLAKSEFLSRMSHELRTPLNAIIGFAQLLELDNQDPPSTGQRERLGLIRKSSWHLLNLINDVLDLTRIEAGRMSVSMEVVAWQAVLDETLSMVRGEASAREVVFEQRVALDTPPTLWADRTRLKQVLLNLLTNAIKYNRQGGQVIVSVTRANAVGATAASVESSDTVLISVRDNGYGLSATQIDHLFQPFNRLGLESNGPEGTGIGLAISLRLTQQMEGSLEVASEPGVGSEFRLRLRAAQIENVLPLAAIEPPMGVIQTRDDVAGTVLYIEDNPANSMLVEQYLHYRPRVKLFQAADGATGLVMAAVCQPDLILIDIRLPDMMGDEVLRQLRAQPETARITCIGVSANAMPHDVEHALQAGFTDYWIKPLDALRFLEGVDRQLQAARQATNPRKLH